MEPVRRLLLTAAFSALTPCFLLQTCCIHLPGHTANLSTVWSCSNSHDAGAGAGASFISSGPLLTRSVPGSPGLYFAAGFYCSDSKCYNGLYCYFPCDDFLFGVYIVYVEDSSTWWSYQDSRTMVVWSANRGRIVRENATLNFTSNGDLLIRDADGSFAWSTNTSGLSVALMTITESGNLVLFNRNSVPVWQSFDHPTDSLLPDQPLALGMRLTPNTSAINLTAINQLYLTVCVDGLSAFLSAFVQSSPPQPYYQSRYDYERNNTQDQHPYAALVNGSLAMFVSSSHANADMEIKHLPSARSLQYMRFESDGHLRLYEWSENSYWSFAEDVLPLDGCEYPNVCGEYGICSNGQCSCQIADDTGTTYFRQIDNLRPNLGCVPEITISCQSVQDHQLIYIPNVTYFSHTATTVLLTDEDGCKQACLRNCSCKAALFHYLFKGPNASCYLLSHAFSILGYPRPQDQLYFYSTYLKVQVAHSRPSAKHSVLIGSTVAGVISLLILIMFASVVAIRRRHQEKDDEDFSKLSGIPTRYAFETLKVATKDFCNKLGEGGFGSVFGGHLGDQSIAVKCLDRTGQGKKEFLAEVETIGGIHHINLVKLIGFCAEKSHKLLVYEYMSRGSLDKWIYYKNSNAPLDWHTRRRIITDIGRGLSYLHEDCKQRIAHLDIKPQNILLDDNFNAKVSDFGLCKLINRDESRVMTRMRGTPGYLAPEWLTSQITEKVDVYSFGVVVMEILSGRKNLDYSQSEGSIQLITVLQEKVKSGHLEDMIDKNSDDMHFHKEEVVDVMKLAMWCLQSDRNRRPAMSLVVKVMEGERNVEDNLDYNFFDLSPAISVPVGRSSSSTPPAASILSAPR